MLARRKARTTKHRHGRTHAAPAMSGRTTVRQRTLERHVRQDADAALSRRLP